MSAIARNARINVKALVILLVVLGAVGVGLFGGHHIRKRVLAERALTDGRDMLASENWPEACKQLRRYLRQYPDDQEMLLAYADANLAVRPRDLDHLASAAGAYRRLLRHRPANKEISNRLATLYVAIGDFDGARYICESRREQDAADAEATLLLARLLLLANELDPARKMLETLVKQHDREAVDAYAILCRLTLEANETEAGVAAARAWLDLGVGKNPNTPGPLIDRAVFHRDDLQGRKTPDFDAARADLESAESLNPQDPDQRLRMARTWTLLGRLRRAAEIIEALGDVDPEVFLGVIDNPERFKLDRYRVAADVQRRVGDPDAMGDLADAALDDLNERFRSAFLPSAIELYVGGKRPARAAEILDEYLALVEKKTRGRSVGDADLSVLRARVAMSGDQPFDVINLLRPIVTRDRDNVSAWRLLAQAYVATDQRDLAMSALKEAARRRDDDVASTAQLAGEHLRRGEWSDAARLARICEERRPERLDLRLLRIEADLHREMDRSIPSDKIAGLREELRDLDTQYPGNAPVLVLQATLAQHEGRLAEAESLLREAVDLPGQTLDAFRSLVAFLARSKRTAEAIELCERTSEQYPGAVRPWIYAARLRLAEDLPRDAEKTLERALQTLTTDDAMRQIRLALAQLRLAYFDRNDGVALYREVAELHPDDIAARNALLETPEILENPSDAARYIAELKAIEGDAGLFWRLHQARAWFTRGAVEEHAPEIEQMLRYCINHQPQWWTRATLLLGRLFETRQDLGAAEAAYRQALTINRNAVDVVERLLGLLQSQNRFADAQDVLDLVTLNAPQLAGHRVGVAIGTGSYDTAIEELETRVAADPKSAGPRLILASLYYGRRSDVDRAFQLLDEASAIDPQSRTPVTIRSRILMAEERIDEAAELLDREVERRQDFSAYALRAEFNVHRNALELAERDYQRLTQFPDNEAMGFELLGRFYGASKRPDAAIEAWENGLEVEPGRESVKRSLVKTLVASEDPAKRAKGVALLDPLLDQHPDDVELLRVRAFALYSNDDPEVREQAIAILNRIVDQDPTAVGAHIAIINSEFNAGRFEEAERLAARAIQSNPTDPDLLVTAARAAQEMGKDSVARNFVRSALDADPQHLSSHIFLFEDALEDGRIEDARRHLAKAREIDPDDPVLRIKSAGLLQMTGQSAAAIAILDELLRTDADVSRSLLLLSLADLHCGEGNAEAFEARVSEAERDDPGNSAIVTTRLRCLAKRRDFDAIAPLVSQHHANHPQDIRTFLLAGELLTNSPARTHLADARALFGRAREADPQSVAAHLGVAKAAYLAGDNDAVIDGYRGALAIDPNHERALNDLAWVLMETGRDIDEALRLTDRGIEQFPLDPHLRDTRGVILTKLRRFDAAVEQLNQAVDFSVALPSTRAKALLHLAEALLAQNRASEAKRRLREAQSIDERQNALSDKERARLATLLEQI